MEPQPTPGQGQPRVLLAIDYDTVVVMLAKDEREVIEALRQQLTRERRQQVSALTHLTRMGQVYFSPSLQMHWYRFPPDKGPRQLALSWVPSVLRPLVPVLEPPSTAWIACTTDPPR